MKIAQVTVHAGGSFNDPYENFRNHRPGVSITADIQEQDNVGTVIENLQYIAAERYETERLRILEERRKEVGAGSQPELEPEKEYRSPPF